MLIVISIKLERRKEIKVERENMERRKAARIKEKGRMNESKLGVSLRTAVKKTRG
jgi:hypothetical protein